MNIFEIVIKCISWINYATASNSTIGMRTKILTFIEDAFLCELPEKIRLLLINNHFTLSYLNYLIRKAKITNEKNELSNIYGIIKEAVREDNVCKIVNENAFVTEFKCYEQIDKAADYGMTLAVFVRSILNILNIMAYSDYETGKNELIKCAKWNHLSSMIILSYVYFIEKNYLESIYWLEMATLINPKYINNKLLERKEEILKNISFNEYQSIIKKVEKDKMVHNLLKDDRLNENFNLEKINSDIVSVLYSPYFSNSEIEKMLFGEGNVKWSVLREIINNSERKDKNIIFKENLYNIENEKYFDIFDNIKKTFKTKENKNVIIINYHGELLKYSIINKIKEYLEDYIVELIDNRNLNLNRFRKIACDMNIFYNSIVNSEKEKFIFLYEIHKVDEEKNIYLYDLINPKEKYYFEDLDISIDKNRMISIVLTEDFDMIPKFILENASIVNIENYTKEEKMKAIKERFEAKQKNFSCENVVFDEDVYEYFNDIPESMIDRQINKMFKSISINKNERFFKKDVEMIFGKKEEKIGFL